MLPVLFRRACAPFKLQCFRHTIFCRPYSQPNLTSPRFKTPACSFQRSAAFSAKIFTDTENDFAYTFLPPLGAPDLKRQPPEITSERDFEALLDQNYRGAAASEIVLTFDKALDFSEKNGITLADHRFDKLVDGLMDHCQDLSDEELLRLLGLLERYPPCDSIKSHNFHDIWSCLDDMCCWRIAAWSLQTRFIVANAWYRLKMGRICDYVFEVLDVMPRKVKRFNKNEVLHTFFYINVCRKRTVNFDFEHRLAELIEEFTLDELGVVAMGYFKSQSKIKVQSIVDVMVRKVGENVETIHEITLAAILKTIRYCQHLHALPNFEQMLNLLTPQIPRLSHSACLHIALIGTSMQYKHAASLTAATDRLLHEITDIRLKDLERILLANAMYDTAAPIQTNSQNIYTAALAELHKPARRKEMTQYSRCLPSALHYLSQRGVFSAQLTNEVLADDFIDDVYGKSPKQLPRELLALDACMEIEPGSYSGNRLTPARKYRAAKWLTDFTPALNQYKKLNTADKLYLEVALQLGNAVGGEALVLHDHVLPHFQRSDMIVCKDLTGGKFVEPWGFENYILGDIKRAPQGGNYQWFAFVITVPNNTLRGTSKPLGALAMKERQLHAIGYTPILVPWKEFSALPPEDKPRFFTKALSA